MSEEYIAKRISYLRNLRGNSARDMSLSIGQNPGYINNIENGKALPSMATFLYICEYLEVSPSEFFEGTSDPEKINEIKEDLLKLNDVQLKNLAFIIHELANQ